ncbi:hypothetical protein PI125_g25291 [Phytophthora idaei]|nr:hypothetical protein PI125_g25291 [Phytophthora idaei]
MYALLLRPATARNQLVCTHGRDKSCRDEGYRTGHQRRGTGCPVILCATVLRCLETGTIWVCATKHKRSHNHKLDKDGFEHYPSNRKVTDPDVLDFVDELIRAGGKPKKILKYLKETTGKRVILRVVHNLVQRLRAKRRGSGSVEARLKAVLRKFFANRDYSPSIFVDDSNKT